MYGSKSIPTAKKDIHLSLKNLKYFFHLKKSDLFAVIPQINVKNK